MSRWILGVLLFAMTTVAGTALVVGQAPPEMPPADLPIDISLGEDMDVNPDGLFGPGGGMGGSSNVTVSAVFTANPPMFYITADIASGWHIYSITQPKGGPVATVIKVPKTASYEVPGPFEANPKPDVKHEAVWGNLNIETHEGQVTWRAPLKLTPGVDPSKLTIQGTVAAQPCSDSACQPPTDYSFTARLGPAPKMAETTTPAPQKKEPAAKAVVKSVEWNEFGFKLIAAFIGGLILNLMPCVLPVISLKLMAFFEQAGESRGRIFALNLWYSLGLMSVFMVLAALASGIALASGRQMSWGEQFSLPQVKIPITALVFVMALSFLGVWEIPIPGFMGSGKIGKLQNKEGVLGAFLKGAFATVLATPCSGPFLAPVFAFLLGRPPYVTFMLFGAMGLGMALPYLVIGAFPRLIRLLPKPGPWMETLKQVMAFLLLGTVVYLLQAMIPRHVLSTSALMVGLWFCCWWIGRTPMTASPAAKWTARIGGVSVAALVGVLAFTVFFGPPKLPWKPFSPQSLKAAREVEKTVMVDYTANWCPNCKLNSFRAIETEAVADLVKKNGVVPLLADWTDRTGTPNAEMIKQSLNELGYNSIPILAIWPAGAEKPIVLPDLINEDQVLEALRKAGPSHGVELSPGKEPWTVR
ncbi:MAG: thioredoxin family protein [Pirellulales bacterium]|nr:thioredoxin family protein [Pirellulales bacterium]